MGDVVLRGGCKERNLVNSSLVLNKNGKPMKRRDLFAREYTRDRNAKEAAIRAGYSPTSAAKLGMRLLKHPDVIYEIEKLDKAAYSRIEVTADRVRQELAKLAFSNMGDYLLPEGNIDLTRLTADQAAAIQEVTVDEAGGGSGDGQRAKVQRVRIKLADKGAALERLARHLGMFNDKLTVDDLRDATDDQLRTRLMIYMETQSRGAC